MEPTDGHFGLEIAFSLPNGLMVKVKAQREGVDPADGPAVIEELFVEARAKALATLAQ